MASSLPYVLFFVAGFGDVVTTAIGIQRGFVETRSFFVPFLSTLIFSGATYAIDRLTTSKTPSALPVILKGGMVALAFTPVVWNTHLLTMKN